MNDPWFDPNTFGMWWGVLVGGVGGSMIGLLGGLTGWLLPKGIGRVWFQAGFAAFAVLGLISLALGFFALYAGQPYGIWYGPLLSGVLFTFLCGGAVFWIHYISRQLEQRRMQSEDIRRS